jgi:hypothetical protein
VKLRALLWAIHRGVEPAAPPTGRISLPRAAHPPELMAACLYLPAGPLYVRADRLEKLGGTLGTAAKAGAFVLDPAWARLVDCEAALLPAIVVALGYRMLREPGDPPRFVPKKARVARGLPADADSPFAALAPLVKP